MQFIGTGDRILTENFNVGYLYTITFKTGIYINSACIGIGDSFVMFQKAEPDLLFTLNVDTADEVDTIELYDSGGGTNDYDDLHNRPQINSHTLTGNMSGADLGLQNTISDLDTIRAGAAAGATAVQPADMTSALAAKQDVLSAAQLAAVNSGITSTDVAQIETNKNNISLSLDANGQKNLFKTTLNHYTHNGVAFDKVNDYTIKLTTASAISAQATCIISDVTFPQNKYAIKVVADGITLANDNVFVNVVYDLVGGSSNQNQNITDVLVFRNSEIIIKGLYVYVRSGKQPNGTIQVMVCPTALYDISDKMQPYALSNATITPALQECVDNGVKNLVNVPDITISASGGGYVTTNNNVVLPAGKYVIIFNATATSGNLLTSFKDSGGNTIGSLELTMNGGQQKGTIFLLAQSSYFNAFANQPTTVTKYMIITEAMYDAGFTDYQPYAMSNVELTAAIQALQAQLANQ